MWQFKSLWKCFICTTKENWGGGIFLLYIQLCITKIFKKGHRIQFSSFFITRFLLLGRWRNNLPQSKACLLSMEKNSEDPTSTKILFPVKNFWAISTLWFYKELFRVIHFDKIRFFAIYQEVLNLALSGMRRIQNTVQGPWKLKKRGFKKFLIFSVGHFLPRNFGKVWCHQ